MSLICNKLSLVQNTPLLPTVERLTFTISDIAIQCFERSINRKGIHIRGDIIKHFINGLFSPMLDKKSFCSLQIFVCNVYFVCKCTRIDWNCDHSKATLVFCKNHWCSCLSNEFNFFVCCSK